MTKRTPSYCRHKATGQAVVRIDGKDHYLGKYGTPESRARYNQLIAEWYANAQALPPAAGGEGLSVAELLLRYWRWAEGYYRDPEGQPTRELENLKDALRPLRELYGHTEAGAFGPLALRALQEKLAETLARGVVNSRVNRVKRVWKWAASFELVPVAVYEALRTVPGLRRGRGKARETAPVAPVPLAHVEAALPHMPAPVAAMVRLQLHSGCRAGEAMVMRACDIDRSGPTWCYRPHRHKGRHRGHERVIFLGPQAREAIRPFLRVSCPSCGASDFPDKVGWRGELCGPCADFAEENGLCGPWPLLTPDDSDYLFSPRRYVEGLHARRAAARKTRRTPSESRRRRSRAPKRQPGERYNRRSYRLAVNRACARAGVPPWTPLQLRHAAATAIRARHGVEAAKTVLGHTRVETSQIYAERDLTKARQIAELMG